jgi:hypothetical protein
MGRTGGVSARQVNVGSLLRHGRHTHGLSRARAQSRLWPLRPSCQGYSLGNRSRLIGQLPTESVVHGECLLMFAEPAGLIHRAHRWVWGAIGKLPQRLVGRWRGPGFDDAGSSIAPLALAKRTIGSTHS